MKKKYGKFRISNADNPKKHSIVELLETFDTLEEAEYSFMGNDSILNCFIMEIYAHDFFR